MWVTFVNTNCFTKISVSDGATRAEAGARRAARDKRDQMACGAWRDHAARDQRDDGRATM